MPTFAWTPKVDPVATSTLRVRTAQFGDGYSQAAQDGLNNKVQSWQLQFTRDNNTIATIANFLDTQAGYQSFTWTPPGGPAGLYRCANYTIQRHAGGLYSTLSATFEQVFS